MADLPLLGRSAEELKLLRQMIGQGINSPLTSSCGRLFDAVAALTGLRGEISYEGQAALELEMVMSRGMEFAAYPCELKTVDGQLIVDPARCIRAIVENVQQDVPVGLISGRFHVTLAHMMVDVCEELRRQSGLQRVVLSGGVFQNRYLTEQAVARLGRAGFEVLTQALVPPNDGGLALGQAVIAGRSGLAGA